MFFFPPKSPPRSSLRLKCFRDTERAHEKSKVRKWKKCFYNQHHISLILYFFLRLPQLQHFVYIFTALMRNPWYSLPLLATALSKYSNANWQHSRIQWTKWTHRIIRGSGVIHVCNALALFAQQYLMFTYYFPVSIPEKSSSTNMLYSTLFAFW